MSVLIPPTHQQAAEEIRQHLVTLRGGAPFLSPADALQLLSWLDDGVSVPVILLALERAAEARRKRRAMTRLSLCHAKRHLNRPTKSIFQGHIHPPKAPAHPLAPLVDELLNQAHRDCRKEALTALARALGGLPTDDPQTLVRCALTAIRNFLATAWNDLTEEQRQKHLALAQAELGDYAGLVDEPTLLAAAEELARDKLRQSYKLLTAAALWDLVEYQEL